jgi:hypothetical protein
MQVAAGLALALGSSAALNWGYLAQHSAAAALPPLTLRQPVRSLRSLFSELSWVIGFVTGIGGWVLYVVALWLAPLSLVQATSAGGIGLLALLVQRRSGKRLPRRDWIAVGVAVSGLALLGVSLAGGSSAGATPSWPQIGAWIAASAVVAVLAAGPAAGVLAGGAGLGIAAGVLYAAGDVGTKAAVHGHAWLLLIPVLLACHGLAFVALQLGFQRGGALATAGVATLFTNALPIAAGVALFHEALPGGALGITRSLAFAGVVAGATLLARQEGNAAPDPHPVLPEAAISNNGA